MKKAFLICLLLIMNNHLFSQTFYGNGSGFGLELDYTYRRAHEFGGGANFLFYSKTDYKTASIFGSSIQGFFLFGNTFNVGSRLNLEYIFWRKNSLGFQINLSGEKNKLINYGLDGRIGINYAGVHYFFYGYNFYRKIPSNLLSVHSIGVIFRINWAIFDLEFH